jgi:Zn finger protein HypA/HybF involved in hydrogenase expression
MCSVGGGDFNIEIGEIEMDRYKCKDCGNKFDGIGEKVICPSCHSANVIRI